MTKRFYRVNTSKIVLRVEGITPEIPHETQVALILLSCHPSSFRIHQDSDTLQARIGALPLLNGLERDQKKINQKSCTLTVSSPESSTPCPMARQQSPILGASTTRNHSNPVPVTEMFDLKFWETGNGFLGFFSTRALRCSHEDFKIVEITNNALWQTGTNDDSASCLLPNEKNMKVFQSLHSRFFVWLAVGNNVESDVKVLTISEKVTSRQGISPADTD